MIQTLDFNSFAAGTVIDNEYRALGVTVSASGGANQAMIFDSANPTGGDDDLASDRLGGVLIISEDGDGADPDDNASGGSLFFDFALPALIKSLTFKDIENGGDARMIFYAEDGSVIDNQWVGGTGDGGEQTVLLSVADVARMEVLLARSGAIDNLIFDDGRTGPGGGNDTVEGTDDDDEIDTGNGDLAPDLGYPFSAADGLGYGPDSAPENDRDLVLGGDGDDTIRTGDDRDTIEGGEGADRIDGGIDDDLIRGDDGEDRIVGGEGNDSILGGAGDDTIYAGNDPLLGLDLLSLPDIALPSFPFSPDRQPFNGRDTVEGGAGNDRIFGGDDADLLSGGTGDDLIDGEIDDDTLIGDRGDDTLRGGQGADSLSGGRGDDLLEGGTGNDSLSGGRGDDTLQGGDEDDRLLGGSGDDLLEGGAGQDRLEAGAGDDSLSGGQGDDLLIGGSGADTMRGGAGEDTFTGVGADDVIDGGSGPVDFDRLLLAGAVPDGGRYEVTYTSADREDGFVDLFDADDDGAGRLTFTEIEAVVPCFTPGTRIATPKGERRVEALGVGDRVITRDNGMQEIRWIGSRPLSAAELLAAPHLRPVLIRAGALGNGLPERDMLVSPQHRVLIVHDKAALFFEEREVLVAAKHLTDRPGIDRVEVSGTVYIHLLFDRHEVILSDGAWTESFQPGDMSLAGVGKAQRREILALFPELATPRGLESFGTARRSLKAFEAKLLTDEI